VVVAREAVDVVSKIEGPIKEVLVNIGDKVKANDKLVEIDDRPIRRDLALVQATLGGARASESKAAIELGDARERNERRKQAGVDVSPEELSSAKYKEKLEGANLQAAQAVVAEQKARVAQLLASLKNTEIRAPFDGTVAARYKGPGSLVGPAIPILRIIQSSDLCVRFAIPVDALRTIKVGMPVNIDVETLHATLEGKVENLAPEVDAASQMLYAEASLAIPKEWKAQLHSGLVARVSPKGPPQPVDGLPR
jgi:RND family efflux transporter MFP subunit